MTDENVDDLLAQLANQRGDYRNQLAELRDATRQIRASFAETVREDPDGLPQDIVDALIRASGPESPYACQRVRNQVEEGLYSWQELYADPQAVAGAEGRTLGNRARRHISMDDVRGDDGPAGGVTAR